MCKNHYRKVTDVLLASITVFENKTHLLKDHFKTEQRTRVRYVLLNRRGQFKIAPLDLIVEYSNVNETTPATKL